MSDRATELLTSWVEIARDGFFGNQFTRDDCESDSIDCDCIVCATEKYLHAAASQEPKR